MLRDGDEAAGARDVLFDIDERHRTSGLLIVPDDAMALFVLAHGAGAGMRHPFMAAAATGLANRGVATLRYQFPFMDRGSRRPDPPALAEATARAAVVLASILAPDLPLFAGGRSFGGRMTSQAQADAPLPGVRGLIFLGFPLHPAKKPSLRRADHLAKVTAPMLFVQGDRDALADASLLSPLVETLGADRFIVKGGDHGFHVPARLHRTEEDGLADILDAVRAWIVSVSNRATGRSSMSV